MSEEAAEVVAVEAAETAFDATLETKLCPAEIQEVMDSGRNIYNTAVRKAPKQKSRTTGWGRKEALGLDF